MFGVTVEIVAWDMHDLRAFLFFFVCVVFFFLRDFGCFYGGGDDATWMTLLY